MLRSLTKAVLFCTLSQSSGTATQSLLYQNGPSTEHHHLHTSSSHDDGYATPHWPHTKQEQRTLARVRRKTLALHLQMCFLRWHLPPHFLWLLPLPPAFLPRPLLLQAWYHWVLMYQLHHQSSVNFSDDFKI